MCSSQDSAPRARPRQRRRPAAVRARASGCAPRARRNSQSVSGDTAATGEASAPSSGSSSSGLAITASSLQHVPDLLLGPVAAAADHVGPQPGPVERLLVGVHAGEGAQQHHHLAAGYARVGQPAQALGEEARLGDVARVGAVVDRELQRLLLLPAVALGEQQLDLGPPPRRPARPRAPTVSGRNSSQHQLRPRRLAAAITPGRERKLPLRRKHLGGRGLSESVALARGRPRRRRGGTRRSTGTRPRRRRPRVPASAAPGPAPSCSAFVSWNSSTRMCAEALRVGLADRLRALAQKRDRPSCRSSKSRPDRSALASAKRRPKSRSELGDVPVRRSPPWLAPAPPLFARSIAARQAPRTRPPWRRSRPHAARRSAGRPCHGAPPRAPARVGDLLPLGCTADLRPRRLSRASSSRQGPVEVGSAAAPAAPARASPRLRSSSWAARTTSRSPSTRRRPTVVRAPRRSDSARNTSSAASKAARAARSASARRARGRRGRFRPPPGGRRAAGGRSRGSS